MMMPTQITMTGSAAAGATPSPVNGLELSQYSNSPTSTNCNLPSSQATYPDTAYSVATDSKTGDQYLGYVTNSASGTAVYAMSYSGSGTAWNTLGASFNYGNTTIYVKSVFATVGLKTYSYMIVNDNITNANQLDLFYSPTLSTSQTNTSYVGAPSTSWDTLSYSSLVVPGTTSFANPRIEAPQYVNSSTLAYVPVWLQYTLSPGIQSLVYWNTVPN